VAGLFSGLQHVLGTVLAFFYDLIPSFGVSIILLTVLINLLLFPLTRRQTRATRAFQTIQPEMKRLQEEYKDDKETLQQELMRTQREAGATPGGCLLPMLIQLPIWWALFRVFRNVALIAQGADGVTPVVPTDSALLAAIEGGDTHFLGMGLGTTMSDGITAGPVGAIPYVALLLTMIAAQYAQQWYAQQGSSSSANVGRGGGQQVLTRIMPLFIGFISWRFPAGLVLYWTTSNLVRLGQQRLIFNLDVSPVPEEPPDQTNDWPEQSPAPKKKSNASRKKKGRRRGKQT
jgi:YidC/Oxa1 family membrane protein insertase